MKYKTKLEGVSYLEQVLNWTSFIKGHRKIALALREVLDELYALREMAERGGAK